MKRKIMIDAHCHMFTKSLFTPDMAGLVGGIRKKALPFFRNGFHMNNEENIAAFLDVADDETPETIYQKMKTEYGRDFIAVPLMMDMVYTMERPADYEKEYKLTGRAKVLNDIKQKTIESQLRFLGWLGRKMSPDELSSSEHAKRINFFRDCYEVQLKELMDLKEKMPNRVYPFFSIDPRRESMIDGGVLSEIKKYVGKGKPFIGLKLYTSLGYSPTHPVLFEGPNSVYAWCERNRIPITVHAAEGGFSNVLSEIKVEGDIYDPKLGDILPMKEYSEDMMLRYQTDILGNTDEMIKERQLLHNHPRLWYKVLKAYPRLKINFAHFGGADQIKAFTHGSKKGFRCQMILDLIMKYPNVYTDLSCFYHSEQGDFSLKEFYQEIYKKLPRKAKRRFMYGSDYYMVLLFRPSLRGYMIEFEREFGDDFKIIANKNPIRFLGLSKIRAR